MLVFIALCYVFFIWLIYFKLKILPSNKKNIVFAAGVGVVMMFALVIIVFSVTPYSKSFFIVSKVNPIAPRVSGIIDEILVQAGEIVEEGTPLFRLEQKDYKFKVKQAEGNFNAAISAYEKAKRQRKIALSLEEADPESISKLQLINTEETEHQLFSQMEAAKSALDQAKNDLSKTVVYAPSKGFVSFIPFDNKTTVSAYQPLFSFVSLSDTYPAATFSQRALAFVENGDKVEFLLDIYPGKIFKGHVAEVEWVAGEAQLFQGQKIPNVNNIQPPYRYIVKMEADEAEKLELGFGMKGEIVVYTEHLKPFHIIQKMHLRISAWLKYLAWP